MKKKEPKNFAIIAGQQKAEVLETLVRIRTDVGEFTLPADIANVTLLPGDSIQFTWTWKGFKPNV